MFVMVVMFQHMWCIGGGGVVQVKSQLQSLGYNFCVVSPQTEYRTVIECFNFELFLGNKANQMKTPVFCWLR